MPDSENGVTLAELLEGNYGLTAVSLKMSADDFTRRLGLWNKLAAQRQTASADQKAAHGQVLALRAWQSQLMGQADKFRAEGDITVEKDIMARVAQVDLWLKSAEAEAGLTLPTAQADHRANPAPEFGAWGLHDG